MGSQVYHGHKTIYWTEYYYDSHGNRHSRSRSQTLHAALEKPKPFYDTVTTLTYCAQAGDNLSFSRNAKHYEKKDSKEIERIVRKGERNLKKLTDEAIKKNSDFMAMANTTFEVLFISQRQCCCMPFMSFLSYILPSSRSSPSALHTPNGQYVHTQLFYLFRLYTTSVTQCYPHRNQLFCTPYRPAMLSCARKFVASAQTNH